MSNPNARIPTAVLKARGSRLAKHRFDVGIEFNNFDFSSPPKWVHKSVRKKWKDVVKFLEPMHVSTVVDEAAIGLLLETFVDYLTVRDEYLSCDELTCVSEKGALTPHPIVKRYADCWKRFFDALQQFGLTPSSRSKVQVHMRGDKDDARVGDGEKDPKRFFA